MTPLDTLRSLGYPVTGLLGSGMEGVVAALDEERVVKLWDRRGRAEVDQLRTFYDAVHHAGFALELPRILEVVEVDGRLLTVQARLHGHVPSADEADLVIDVLATLADLPVHPDMAVLPVPDGEAPFDPRLPFATSLADLVERRAPLLGDHLDTGTTAALASDLRSLTNVSPRLVHGDLGPGNLLVSGGRPSGLLDFGYVSTVGDPAFDAAVAVVLADMFGPGADATRARIQGLVVERFGYDADRLALYRAAYGLVTASCLVAAGDGSHFRWCLDLLRR